MRKGFTSLVGYMTIAPSMVRITLSASILARRQLQECRTKCCGVARSGTPDYSGDGSRRPRNVIEVNDPMYSFLSIEEARVIDFTNLDIPEKFVARMTVASLNLLKEISRQDGIPIAELNVGRVRDWFVRDREKREKNAEGGTL